MKPCVIHIFLAFLVLSISLIIHQPLYACEQWQQKADRVAALKRKGGNAKQMNRWDRQKKGYAERYYECERSRPKIHAVSKSPPKKRNIKPERQKMRVSSSENPVTQQLLSTCNFWITTANRNPTADNKNFRATACTALDRAERTPPVITTPAQTRRGVQECIKPGNLLDDDVQACMAGEREPYWRDD